MKKMDYWLLCIAVLIVIFLCGSNWRFFLKLLMGVILVVFVVYWKIIPYKTMLLKKYQDVFNAIDKIVNPIITLLQFIPKIKLGNNFQLDTSFLVVVSVIILTLIIL